MEITLSEHFPLVFQFSQFLINIFLKGGEIYVTMSLFINSPEFLMIHAGTTLMTQKKTLVT